jgi:hypothetical protein
VQAEQADVAGDEAAGQPGLDEHLQQHDDGQRADDGDRPPRRGRPGGDGAGRRQELVLGHRLSVPPERGRRIRRRT